MTAAKKEKPVRIREIFFLLFFLIALFAIRMPVTYMPLDRDEGAYSYIAERMPHGELPYKDTFDHKPPFIYYIYRTAFSFSGVNVEAIRNFTTVYMCFVMITLYMLARTMWGARAACIAVFAYFLAQNNPMYQGFASNLEIFTQLPLLAAMFFTADMDEKSSHISYFIAGFFCAVAFYVKSMAVFVAAVPALHILLYKRKKAKNLIWYMSGFIFVSMLVTAWAAKNNMLAEFWKCNVLYNIAYIGSHNSRYPVDVLFKSAITFIKDNLFACVAMLYLVYALEKDNRDKNIFLTVCFASALYLGVASLRGAYPHYYIMLVPFMALAAGYALSDLTAHVAEVVGEKSRGVKQGDEAGGKAGYIVLSIVLTAALVYQVWVSNIAAYLKSNLQTMDIFYQTRFLAGEIERQRNKNSTLYVYPNEPEIYFYTGIKAPSRFIYAYPFEVYKEELPKMISFMNEHPTEFFVCEKGATGIFRAIIEQKYRKISETRDMILYGKL